MGGTPKEIMNHSPEFTYRRLLAAADMARKLGAQIMGLGAFTKVVGDAGVTVARQAPLPITTGNSYSASGALWAAHDALLRMRLLPTPHGKGRVKFKAMVVGATGAIGSACARLLVRAAEEVYLVSPETAKLLALKAVDRAGEPRRQGGPRRHAPTRDLPQMDMIVTATSGAGKKVLDIMKVKPGCVITDVARPLDLPPERGGQAARRAGHRVGRDPAARRGAHEEHRPADAAWPTPAWPRPSCWRWRAASRTSPSAAQIEWPKVREIYQLGLKHGMKLAAISGVNGEFSDEDIARVRELALAARARAGHGADEHPANEDPTVDARARRGAPRRRESA